VTDLLARLDAARDRILGEAPDDGVLCPVEIGGKVAAVVGGFLVVAAVCGAGPALYFLEGQL
jgi:hypothetical protein